VPRPSPKEGGAETVLPTAPGGIDGSEANAERHAVVGRMQREKTMMTSKPTAAAAFDQPQYPVGQFIYLFIYIYIYIFFKFYF